MVLNFRKIDMNKSDMLGHKVHLELEVEHLKKQIMEHDTGHIITAIDVLNHRIREIENKVLEEV